MRQWGETERDVQGAFYLFMTLIPLSLGVAILRYRLWDIDLIVNRTLGYAALTIGVVAPYTLVVGGLGALLQAPGSPLVALLATGLVAVAFGPLCLRLQRGVNRILYGARRALCRARARRLPLPLTPFSTS